MVASFFLLQCIIRVAIFEYFMFASEKSLSPGAWGYGTSSHRHIVSRQIQAITGRRTQEAGGSISFFRGPHYTRWNTSAPSIGSHRAQREQQLAASRA